MATPCVSSFLSSTNVATLPGLPGVPLCVSLPCHILRAKPLTLPTKVFPCLNPGFQTNEPYPKTQRDVESSILPLLNLFSAACTFACCWKNPWNVSLVSLIHPIQSQTFQPQSLTHTIATHASRSLEVFMQSLQGPQRRNWGRGGCLEDGD